MMDDLAPTKTTQQLRDAAPLGAWIQAEVEAVERMLLAKNIAYGNSALDPVRIFSRAEADEQIRVRIDDKLSRLQRGAAAGEDVELDLIGYLLLLRVWRRVDGAKKVAPKDAGEEGR